MIDKVFVQKSSNVFAENRILKFGFICVVIWSGVLYVKLEEATDGKTIQVMPFCGPGTYDMSGSAASDQYLREMTKLIVSLIGNINAGNARNNYSEVLPHFVAESYPRYQNLFNKLASDIERFPNIGYKVDINEGAPLKIEGNTISVEISKSRIVGSEVKPSEQVIYEIVYRMTHGRFQIVDINEIVKNA